MLNDCQQLLGGSSPVVEISHILESDAFGANDNWIEDELLVDALALTGIKDRVVPI